MKKIEKIYCNVCSFELVEDYKNCECRLCEDWGGCKDMVGYYFLKCPECKIEYATTKINRWEVDLKHKTY